MSLSGIILYYSKLEDIQGEVEALQSIYEDEYEEISSNPIHYRIHMLPDPSVGAYLHIQYPDDYPNCIPNIEIEKDLNLTDSQANDLLSYLKEQATSLVGDVMVYSLVDNAIEWLGTNNVKPSGNLHEEMMKDLEKQKEEQRKVEVKQIEIENRIKEEEHQRRLNGTRVTPETFKIWKDKFLKEKEEELTHNDEDKPTGKQLFMRNKSLFSEENYDKEEMVIDSELYNDDVDGLDDIDDDDDENDDEEENEEQEEGTDKKENIPQPPSISC